MSLHDRIKEARKNKGLTQEQLGALIGVAKTTITGYEKNREPTAAKIGEIAEALGVDANFLYQDEIKELYKHKATPDEFEKIIKKYRALDPHGREMVDFTLEKEYERSKKLSPNEEPDIKYHSSTTESIDEYGINAAHRRTDINVTNDMKKYDENIMDDDDF